MLGQLLLSTDDTLLSEVVGVVVRHAQEVIARLLQQMGITGRCAEGITVATTALRALTTIQEGALQITYGKGGTLQDRLYVTENLLSVLGRQ